MRSARLGSVFSSTRGARHSGHSGFLRRLLCRHCRQKLFWQQAAMRGSSSRPRQMGQESASSSSCAAGTTSCAARGFSVSGGGGRWYGGGSSYGGGVSYEEKFVPMEASQPSTWSSLRVSLHRTKVVNLHAQKTRTERHHKVTAFESTATRRRPSANQQLPALYRRACGFCLRPIGPKSARRRPYARAVRARTGRVRRSVMFSVASYHGREQVP